MTKQTKRTIIGVGAGIIVMLAMRYLCPVSDAMTKEAWTYLGCFAFLLISLISKALVDWAATLLTMFFLVAFKVADIPTVTSQFSGSTLWLCIGVFVMSIGINNSGFMKRLALWVLTKFPGTYMAQVVAMLIAGLITTPLIPSSYAKTSIMAPLVVQVCEAVGAKPNSKAARGLWFANFMGTYVLGMAFLSGSAFVAVMMGFMKEIQFTWGGWLKYTVLWYVATIILTFIYSAIICKPDQKLRGDVSFLKEQYKALGKPTLKEKQGAIIILFAIVLWLTESLHGINAGMVCLCVDVAFVMCGLIDTKEFGAKGMWNTTIFVGGMLSIADLMKSTGASTWIASVLNPVLSPILVSPYVFVPVLCIIVFALRYVIASQTCMLTMMYAIFAPLLPGYGYSIFVLVFVEWVCGTNWQTSYGNPAVFGFVKMTGEKCIDFPTAQKTSYAYMIITTVAMTLSVPLWHSFGLL